MSMEVVPLRLQPGVDLRRALEAWIGEQGEQAGCLISGIGSLSVAQLRLAGASEATVIRGDLEILSLCGTLSSDGAHLHITLAGSNSAAIGGHLCGGSLVRTTAELVIGLLPEWRFRREHDPTTGYAELQISRKGACPPDSRQPLWGLGGCHCLQARLALLAASRRFRGGIAQAAGQWVKR